MASRAGRGQGLTIGTSSPQPARQTLLAVDEDQLASSLAAIVSNDIRAVVWDFDLTLLAIHAYGERITPTDVHATRSMESDFRDLYFFKRISNELSSRGISVAIASFGKYDVIQAYMDRALYGRDRSAEGSDGTPSGAGLSAALASASSSADGACVHPPRLFNRANILTPSVLGLKDGWSMPSGKNELLEHYRKETGLSPRQILFFDDDGANVRKAMEAGYPFCLYTPTGFHFGTWLEAVGNFAGHGSPFSSAAGRKALDFSGSSSAASLSSSTGPGRTVDPASYHTPAK